MKIKYLLTITLLALTLVVCIGSAQAATFITPSDSNSSVSVNDKTPVKDLNILAQDIIVNAPVNGDIVGAGNTILVTGPVSNSAFLLGNNITSQGTISHHIRAAGQTVNVSSLVDGDAYIAGSNVNITNGADIMGDLFVAGANVSIDGTVHGNVVAYASSLTINGVIDGNLMYHSDSQASIGSGAKIVGQTTYTKIATKHDSDNGLFLKVVFLIGTILLLLVISFAWPKTSSTIVKNFATNPIQKFGLGLLGFIALPVIGIILAVTVVGLPISLTLFAVLFVLWLASLLISKLAVGSIVIKLITNNDSYSVGWREAVAGGLIMFIANLIPFLGPIIQFVVIGMAAGAIIVLFNIEKRAKQESGNDGHES